MNFGWIDDSVSAPLWIQELRRELKREMDHTRDIGYEEGLSEGALLTREASYVITAAQKYVENQDTFSLGRLKNAVEVWQNKRDDISEFMATTLSDIKKKQ